MMWLMMLWMMVFWVVVIAGAAWLFGALAGRRRGRAAEILDERLARAEIDADEHRRLRAEIAGGAPRRGVLVIGAVVAALVVLFVVVPVGILAAGGWDMDMWDMHGSGRNTSNSPVVQAGSEASVTIDDFAFAPGNLEVDRGASVTWTNRDGAPHDATARSGAWNTDRLSRDESDTLTFDTPGVYDYYCTIHPSMKAKLVVR